MSSKASYRGAVVEVYYGGALWRRHLVFAKSLGEVWLFP
jgi:hypothetical protein